MLSFLSGSIVIYLFVVFLYFAMYIETNSCYDDTIYFAILGKRSYFKKSQKQTISLTSFEEMDRTYGQNNNYIQKISSISILRNMSNEKVCFHKMVPYERKAKLRQVCTNSSGILQFYTQHKSDLFYRCENRETFSHCQEFYLLIFNQTSSQCASFERKPCLEYIFLMTNRFTKWF